MSEELKRCPHCGSKAVYVHSMAYDWVKCGNMNCHNTATISVRYWNTRPIEDELQAQIDQLTAERDELKNELENERDTRKNELGSGLLTTLVNGNALEVRHLKQELAELQLENELLKGKMNQMEFEMFAADNFSKQLEAELAKWKQDAERLAGAETDIYSEGDEEYISCVHSGSCGYHVYRRKGAEFIHAPNCPITLHRELVAKYGGENNES